MNSFYSMLLKTQVSISIADIASVGFILAGLFIFVNWLFRYGGFSSLAKAPVRRNTMPVYMGFAAVILWLAVSVVCMFLLDLLPDDIDESVEEICVYLISVVTQICLMVIFLRLAKKHFARGLKGFGLNLRTVPRDFGMAAVNITAVYPLVMGGLLAVLAIGKHLYGEDWQIAPHESITTLSAGGPVVLQVLVIFTAVVLAPVFEEIMFRGIFQSVVTSAIGMPWVAVVMTSILFTLQHPKQHCLAIFALSMGLGYTYERSGSLWRSIFMHMMFNTISVVATMLMT